MPDTGDIGYRTCSICGVMYNRFVINDCPLCKLRKEFTDTDTDNDRNRKEDTQIAMGGWNGDI